MERGEAENKYVLCQIYVHSHTVLQTALHARGTQSRGRDYEKFL